MGGALATPLIPAPFPPTTSLVMMEWETMLWRLSRELLFTIPRLGPTSTPASSPG